MKKNNRTTFKPFKQPDLKVYLYTKHQDINHFYALIQAIDLINKEVDNIRIGIAVENPALRKLSEYVTWAALPPLYLEEVKKQGNQLICIDATEEEIYTYQKLDHQKDFEIQVNKYPNIDPEQLKPPVFHYSSPMGIIRKSFEIFEIMPGGRPVALYDYVRNPINLPLKSLNTNIHRILNKYNISNQPYCLVEEGFADWDNRITNENFPWQNTIILPKADNLINDTENISDYLGLMFQPNCAALGIQSTDYIVPSIIAWHKNKNVIWDLRPSKLSLLETVQSRQLMANHLPCGNVTISMIMPLQEEPSLQIKDDLVNGICSYYNHHLPAIKENKLRTLPPRPLCPADFTYPWRNQV